MKALVVFLFSMSAVLASPMYSVLDLGILPAEPNNGFPASMAWAINGHGNVVGTSRHRSFLYDSTLHDLGSFGGYDSAAYGINDSGLIVGYSDIRNPQRQPHPRAYVYRNGRMEDLGTFGGDSSMAFAVNNSGTAVGFATSWEYTHAFRWRGDGLEDIGTLGGAMSYAYGVNDADVIVGGSTNRSGNYRAFRYEDGSMSELRTMYELTSAAFAINSTGSVVGTAQYSTDSYSVHAALWTEEGFSDLGTFGGSMSIARGINSAGWVVGKAGFPSEEESAFLYRGFGLEDLNSLADSPWWIIDATGINDRGQIAATGYIQGIGQHALLLTPIPEPSTLLLLLCGLVPLFLRKR